MSKTRPVSLLAPALALTLHALAAGAAPVRAQQPPDTFRLDEVVVTATRTAMPRSAVPAAVTVLLGADLRARGVRSVADALREVPGAAVVRSGSHGGLTSLFLRGGQSDYVQVMVDGVVLNEPGGAVDLGQLTTDNVERIEVVRGPVSVLYGSDAVTGVVNIVTRRGEGDARLTGGVDFGRAPRRNGDAELCPDYPREACPAGAELGSYLTRAWDAGLSGSRPGLQYAFGASGFDTEGAYAFNNDWTNRTLSGKLATSGSAGTVALTARHTDGVYHFPTGSDGRLVDRNVFRSSESLALGLEASRRLAPRLEARAALSYHRGENRTVDAQDSPADTLGFFASTSAGLVDRRKADLHAHLDLPAATVATLGFEAELQDGSSSFTSESEYGPYDDSSRNDRNNRAAYAQVISAPHPALTLTAGARTEDNDRFGRFLTWRTGANLRVAGATTLRASAGTAFKEPTFFQNYATGFTLGNTALEPEESRSWEVGVEHAFGGGRAVVGATWFDQRFQNLIQYTGAPAPGEPNYRNVGEAASRGLEVEARLRLPGGGSLAGNWVRLDTEVLDAGFGTDALFQQGERLIRRPQSRFNISAAAPFGPRATGGATFTHVGERDDLDFLDSWSGARVTLPSHGVLDVFTEVRVLTRGARTLALHARVENLTGEDYREVANFPSPGRALYVGLRAVTGF